MNQMRRFLICSVSGKLSNMSCTRVNVLTAVCTASASTILVDASRSSHDRGEDPRIGARSAPLA